MHEVDVRMIKEEMIVQGGHAESVVKRDGHHRIYFVFKENGVAHYHRAVFRFLERRPGSEAHEGRHRPAVDCDFYVVARESDLIDTFLLDHLSLEPGQLVDTRRIEICR